MRDTPPSRAAPRLSATTATKHSRPTPLNVTPRVCVTSRLVRQRRAPDGNPPRGEAPRVRAWLMCRAGGHAAASLATNRRGLHHVVDHPDHPADRRARALHPGPRPGSLNHGIRTRHLPAGPRTDPGLRGPRRDRRRRPHDGGIHPGGGRGFGHRADGRHRQPVAWRPQRQHHHPLGRHPDDDRAHATATGARLRGRRASGRCGGGPGGSRGRRPTAPPACGCRPRSCGRPSGCRTSRCSGSGRCAPRPRRCSCPG